MLDGRPHRGLIKVLPDVIRRSVTQPLRTVALKGLSMCGSVMELDRNLGLFLKKGKGLWFMGHQVEWVGKGSVGAEAKRLFWMRGRDADGAVDQVARAFANSEDSGDSGRSSPCDRSGTSVNFMCLQGRQ